MNNLLKVLIASVSHILPVTVAGQVAQSEIVVALSEAPNQSGYDIGDQFSMLITYDTSLLSGEGEEVLTVEDILSLSFEFGESTYDETYDSASSYPRLYFDDAQLVSVDYWNNTGLIEGGDQSFFRFLNDQTFNYSPYGESEFVGEYSVIAVPESESTLFLSIALWMILLRRHRK